MQKMKISPNKEGPCFQLIDKIQELEKLLVSDSMISKMHNSVALARKAEIVISLLNISKKFGFLGYGRRATRVYIRALKIYDKFLR